jgi:hypothetical protein
MSVRQSSPRRCTIDCIYHISISISIAIASNSIAIGASTGSPESRSDWLGHIYTKV